MHREALKIRIDNELALPNYRVILLNSSQTLTDTTPLAEILQWEPVQATGSYEPQTFSYTAGTSTYDSGISYQISPNVTVNFTEGISNAGYSHTHAVLWQGRTRSNRAIQSVSTSTGQINCTGHGLANGDKAFIKSSGSLPTGFAIQTYYVTTLTSDAFELYSDVARTTKITPSSTGTGNLYLYYANGAPFQVTSLTGTVAPGQTKPIIVSYQVQ